MLSKSRPGTSRAAILFQVVDKNGGKAVNVKTNSATRTILQAAGDALDQAEARGGALHRLRSRFESKRVSRMQAYGRPYLQPNSAGDQSSFELVWCPPLRRVVNVYWRTLKASIKYDPYFDGDLRTCRASFKAAREAYETKTEYRSHDVEWRDGGESVSLRAILDARAVMVETFMILEQVEGRAKYLRQIEANKRAAVNLRKFKRKNPEAYAQRKRTERRRWT
jgi:hypothetical protein